MLVDVEGLEAFGTLCYRDDGPPDGGSHRFGTRTPRPSAAPHRSTRIGHAEPSDRHQVDLRVDAVDCYACKIDGFICEERPQ